MASPTDREAAPDVAPDEGVAARATSGHDPAPALERVTAPDVTTPSVEAAGLPPPTSAPSASEQCSGNLQHVIIGYEPGIPLQGGAVETRAMRVLERAFPDGCYERTLTSMRREDLAPSIVKGKIDVGIVALPAASRFTDKDVNMLPAADDAGVDVVMLQPASYAVVAAKRETMEEMTSDHPSVWMFVPLGLLAGVVTLVFVTYLLNFRVARGPDVTPAHTRIDPRLARLGSAVHWMYSATSGRLLSVIWSVLGVTLISKLVMTHDVVEATARRVDLNSLEGAAQAAYPGRDIYELRNEHWTKCSQPYKCLQNYQSNVTLALAGDRDVLCRYQGESRSTKLEFVDEVAIPILYAFLLPPAATSAPDEPTSVGDRVVDALRNEPNLGSPFGACPEPAVTAELR
jgi:hypothetical protein